jgi:hypothetical protein
VYNAARGIWVGGGADFGNHPAVGALSVQAAPNAVIIGSRGDTGDQGDVGYTGSAVLRGQTKLSGYTGSRGEVGDQGPVGSRGTGAIGVLKDLRLVSSSATTLNFIGSRVTVTSGNNSTAQINVNSIDTGNTRTVATLGPVSMSPTAMRGWNTSINSKTYVLYSIETSAGAWVRIYSSGEESTADLDRPILADPAPNNGIIAEAITTGVATSKVLFTPAVFGSNNDPTPTSTMYVRVANNSGVTQPQLTVTITYLPL